MVATTYEAELATNSPANIFKGLGGIIYAAELSVAIPTAFTSGATSDLVQLPAPDWSRLGLITKGDGITFSRDIATAEEESWGYNEPVRTDITSDITSAAFTLQEVNRTTLELFDFVDLSSLTPDSTTGEVAYNKPNISAPIYKRLIFMAVDGAGTDRRYRFKIMPRAQVTGVNDEVWSQENATTYPFTIRATVDPTLGYAVRNVLAGPGQKSRNAAAGFGA